MNKLTKLLSIFLIAGAVGTGIAGVAGCNKGKGSGSGGGGGGGGGGEGVQHTDAHNQQLHYDDLHNGKHKITCNVDGCTYEDEEDHKYDDENDATCNFCDYVRDLGGEGPGDDDKYDLVTTSVNFDEAAKDINASASGNFAIPENYTYKDKVTFTATGKSRFEVGSNCFNTQGESGTIIIKLSGETNSLSIAGKGASGNFTGYSLTNVSGTAVKEEALEGQVEFSFELTDLPKGTYTLTTHGGAARIKKIEFTEKLAKSEATGISVSALNVDFLKGEDLNTSGLEVKLHYSNGRIDPLDKTKYEITQESLEGVDKNTAGKYTVTVKYKENTAFTASYDVYYYTIDEIEMHTIGYNGTKQLTLQQAAVTGGELSNANLTVKGKGTVGEGKNARTHTFNLPTSTLNIEEVSTAAEGEKTVNVSVKSEYTTGGKTLADSYKVIVKNAVTAENDKVEITVGETGEFKTLTQAVQFIELCNIDDNVNKVIKLQAGTYNEKVWLELPNVTLMGLGDNIDDTVLTYSVVEGDRDAINGNVWGLGCATLHVTGKNFKAYNLAIRNDFDYIKYSGNYSGTTAAQGVALTLEGDGNVIYKCHLYGNQDTLYMKKGRTYYYQSQIDGNVDFIFGNETGLGYFEDCKIVAINRTKITLTEEDKAAGKTEEDIKGAEQNGYVTAAKHDGNNVPDYGYVFYNCQLTDDGKVKDGAMSLGRPWGKKATVAYIGCSFSKAYSVLSSDAEGKDHRWSEMSGAKPENAYFKEYGSTGEGALTQLPEGFKGGSLLSEEDAAKYTKDNLFGEANGKKVGYDAKFDYATAYSNLRILVGLDAGEIVLDTTVDYKFSKFYTKGDAANTYHATAAEGEEIFGGAATVYGSWGHELNQDKDHAKFAKDTVIKFNIAGKVSVTTYGPASGTSYGMPENIDLNYINGKAVITIVATETYPITNGCYITLIQLDKSLTNEAHIHKYGAWTVTKDESAETYTATRTCKDCELETAHTQTVNLPALNATDYQLSPSQTSDKFIYTYTDETYGDITFEADAIDVHVHDYGEWVITATAETAGTATKTCEGTIGTCDHTTVTVDIPALNSGEYTITNNTAKLDEAGTGTYTITVGEETVTFNAATPAITLPRATQSFTYNYTQGNLTDNNPVPNNAYVVFDKCYVNNMWIRFSAGSTITLNLPEGATLKFTRSPHDNASTIKINGVEQEGAKGTVVQYVVRVPGYVVITAEATAYFKDLEVIIDPDYQHSGHYYGEWDITAPSTEETGTATRTCLVPDCGLANPEQTVDLPVLSTEDYTIKASQNAGKSIYTLKSNETISFEADTLAGMHVHNYGDTWTYDADTSKITKTCTGGADCDVPTIEKEVPALTDSGYVITNNTATLDAAGTGTYTIVLDGETYSFTAATPKFEPTLISKTTSVDIGNIGHNVEGIVETYKGVVIDAKAGKVRDNTGSVQINPGTKIYLKVNEGAQIKITWYNNEVKYGTDDNADIQIDNGIAVITIQADPDTNHTGDAVHGGSGIYIRTITVLYPAPALETITEAKTFSDCSSVDSTTEIEFSLVSPYNNNNYWKFDSVDGYIKFKVAAGAKITLTSSYWGGDIKVNGETTTVTKNDDEGTVVLENQSGEIIITPASGSSTYLTEIKIEYPDATEAE